jgi:hypothetical protein
MNLGRRVYAAGRRIEELGIGAGGQIVNGFDSHIHWYASLSAREVGRKKVVHSPFLVGASLPESEKH